MTVSELPRFWKVADIAAKAGAHEYTIQSWLRQGKFPHAFKLGRYAPWRVPHADVIAFLEGQTTPPVEAEPRETDAVDAVIAIWSDLADDQRARLAELVARAAVKTEDVNLE